MSSEALQTEPGRYSSAQVWRTALLVFLFLLLCFSRLYNLEWKTLMHDETLFLYYTHDQIYKNWTYVYLPILHGPAMLHLQSLTFHIFGTTDFTLRLGCALLGIAGFFWILKLRPWLGEVGLIAALVFYLLSPGISYYQRFFRNDALFLFNTLWIITSLAQWWRFRKPGWLASAIMGWTVLFANKESSLFVYFSVITFLIVFLIHDVVSGVMQGRSTKRCDVESKPIRFPNPIFPTLIVWGFVILCLTMIFEGMIYDDDVVAAIGHDWVLKNIRSIPILLGWAAPTAQSAPDAGGTIARSYWLAFYLVSFVGIFVAFALLRFAANHRIGRTLAAAGLWERIHASRWHLLGAIALATVVYLWIFTTGFHNPTGFFHIYEKTWSYWGGQHEWGRIGGPFHQHTLNMLVYELPAVLIVSFAWIWGLFRLSPSRITGVAFILMLLPVAAFQKLIFSGIEISPGPAGVYTPIAVPYLKTIFYWGGAIALAILLVPRSGRLLIPLSFLGLLVYSIRYFSSMDWLRVLRTPIYKDGEAVRLSNRHVDLFNYMEIQFNFDGGTSLAIVLTLIFFATLWTWYELEKGNRFHAFLIWWTVTSTGAASYAREAVPQVGIHAMLPLGLLACSYINRAWYAIKLPALRFSFIGLLGFFVLWNTKQTTMLNFYYPDDPRERMVYGPTPQDLLNHAKFVQDYARIAPVRVENDGVLTYYRHPNDRRLHKMVRVGITNDVTVWPNRWYLRDIEWWEEKTPERFLRENYEFMFVKTDDPDKFPAIKENYHTFLGSGMRFWVPSPLDIRKLIGIWKEWIPGHYLDASPQAVPAWEAKEEWKKIWRYYIFRDTFHENISGTQYVFCVRKDLY